MNLYATLACAMLTLSMVSACNNGKKTSDESMAPSKQASSKVDSLQRMNDYHYSDRVDWNGRTVVYEVNRHAVDSLPVVTDETGIRYTDNVLSLTVSKEGGLIFHKTFYKHSFKSFLDSDFYKHAILEGMAFDRIENGKLCFSVSISYPMSDLYIPLLISFDSNGNYVITQDLVLDNVVETMDSAESV